jgi:hypothetical protein
MKSLSNPHNLRSLPAEIKPFGVRVSLRSGDPFRKLLGQDWSSTHWYASAAERDAVLTDMSRQHDYSRSGDAPALRFEKVEDLAARGHR